MDRIKCATFDKDMQNSIPIEIREKMKADRDKAEKENESKAKTLLKHSVSPRYFLVVQEYGDDEFFLNVISSKFLTYKNANEWLNNEATKIKFPHAYIISVY